MFKIEKPPQINFRDPGILLATWFGCGLMKPAPGTWGSLGALPVLLPALVIGGWPALLVLTLLLTAVGYWAAGRFEKQAGTHDPPLIVIDEVAGMGIALLPAALSPLSVASAFLAFRLFDILKPWPVSWADKKIGGAKGVMADDLIAGIMAAIVTGGLRLAGFG